MTEKELKNLNKTMSSIRTFIILNSQLTKNVLNELKRLNNEISHIKKIMEVKWQVLEEKI